MGGCAAGGAIIGFDLVSPRIFAPFGEICFSALPLPFSFTCVVVRLRARRFAGTISRGPWTRGRARTGSIGFSRRERGWVSSAAARRRFASRNSFFARRRHFFALRSAAFASFRFFLAAFASCFAAVTVISAPARRVRAAFKLSLGASDSSEISMPQTNRRAGRCVDETFGLL